MKVDITKNETLEADLSKFFGIKLLAPFPLAGQVFENSIDFASKISFRCWVVLDSKEVLGSIES